MRLPIAGSAGTKTVNVKGWDGHPWYIEGERRSEGGWDSGNAFVHRSHRKKRFEKAPVEGYDMEEYRKNREEEKKDPFFSLDTD